MLLTDCEKAVNIAVAPAEILKTFFAPETDPGSVLFFYLTEEDLEVEGKATGMRSFESP